jgi:hypothetical protein
MSLGVLVFLVSLGGEALADAQLDAFRKNPANAGKVCREGLWRYSRHPNYFFEWLVWCAYALMATFGPRGAGLSWVCPALMLYFLLRVTGIPAMTEEQADPQSRRRLPQLPGDHERLRALAAKDAVPESSVHGEVDSRLPGAAVQPVYCASCLSGPPPTLFFPSVANVSSKRPVSDLIR